MRAVPAVLALVFALLCGGLSATAQTAADEDMAWITDRDETFFYLAYAVPESDRFAIAFICNLKDRKTFVALHEKQGAEVKAGDKFSMTLQIGDTKTELQAETSFEASEEMLRSVAPIAPDDRIFSALGNAGSLEVIRAGKTMQFSLSEIADRLDEFRQGCGIRK